MEKNKTIANSLRQCLFTEAQTLFSLAEALPEPLAPIVQVLSSCQGKIVLVGVGKNAIVAQKVAATLNSLGTPSSYIHAADAIHGDIGSIQAYDIVMCLSKSGETQEFKNLIPPLKKLNTTIIGITSEADSFLANHSDYVILVPIEKEADPYNLAPTASTTAMMAIGDAIAVTLAQLNSFRPKDFAASHPGGSLGKLLHQTVDEIALTHLKPSVQKTSSIQEAIFEISSKRLGATAVLDDQEELIGIITDGDIRRFLQTNSDLNAASASDAMSNNPRTISSDSTAFEALQIMKTNSITQVLVTQNGKYIGMVHLHDLIRLSF